MAFRSPALASSLLIIALSATALSANATQAVGEQARPCLNYWQRGSADPCAEAKPPVKPSPTTPRPPTPTIVVMPQAAAASPTLDTKIDKFLDSYGKPPREFVAFYLDPTPENAVKWVHTYQEILTRPQQLAYVWTQAESLYADALKKGAPAASYTSTTFAPVKDFGIPIAGFTSPITNPTPFKPQLAMGAAAQGVPGLPAGGSLSATPLGGAGLPGGTPGTLASAAAAIPNSLGGLSMGTLATQADANANLPGLTNDLNPTAAQSQLQANQSLDLTYYFAASCPFSHRLTPELNRVMSDLSTALPNKVKMTCVDLTPYMGPPLPGHPQEGPQPGNIAGQLPCTWRTPTQGEEDQLGITQTPTLLVRRGNNSTPERVNGYVEGERLKSFLLNGTPL